MDHDTLIRTAEHEAESTNSNAMRALIDEVRRLRAKNELLTKWICRMEGEAYAARLAKEIK